MNNLKLHKVAASIHTLLLVLFFLLHNYLVYYGMVSFSAVLIVLCKLTAIILLFVLLSWVISKDLRKSLLTASITGAFFLFYGDIKDLVSSVAPFIAKYTILLPATILSIVLLTRISTRTRNVQRAGILLTLLFTFWLIIDVIGLAFNDPATYLRKNLLVNQKEIKKRGTDSTLKPDIYLLILDSYPGESFLKDQLAYDNGLFDAALNARGFRVLKHPRSNYNRTAFSIASLLNASYLSSINSSNNLVAKNYNRARASIEHARVPGFLLNQGYDFYNLSVFDIAGKPSIRRETFLTLPEERVLIYNTLPERIRTDILWNFAEGRFHWKFAKSLFSNNRSKGKYDQKNFNDKVIDSLKKIPAISAKGPKFIYAHLYLPHPPFFYDDLGNSNPEEKVIDPGSMENRELFLSYLRYTNITTLSIVDQIQARSPGCVIILLSDHGYRDFKGWKSHPEYFNVNFAAWYFPDRGYKQLYDSMTNVNTFPVLFNKYFNTELPLMKDSVVYLPY